VDISGTAAIADSKLAQITSANKVADSALSNNVALLGSNNTFAGTVAVSNTSTTAFQVQKALAGLPVLVADTTNMRLAVNQASATYTLDVAGDINSTTGLRVGGTLVCTSSGCGASSATAILNGTAVQSANYYIRSAAAGSIGAVVEAANSQSVDVFDVQAFGGTKYLVVDKNGNTTLGATAPTFGERLSVVTANNAPGIYINNSMASGYLSTVLSVNSAQADSSSYNLLAATNGTGSKFLIRGDGNVGIGTSSPTNKLTITDGATPYALADASQLLQIKRNASNGASANGASILLANNSNGFSLKYGGTTDRLGFIDGGSNEDLTILNGGNVGIGNTNPTNYKLEVDSSASTATIGVINSNDYTGSTYDIMQIGSVATNGAYLGLGANQTSHYSYIQSKDAGVGYYNLLLNPNGGNVGIGEAPSLFKLQTASSIAVDSGSNTYVTLGVDPGGSSSPTTYGGLYFDASKNLRIEALSGGVAWRNIVLQGQGGGSVGIGGSPSYKLDVGGDIKTSTYLRASGYGLQASPTTYGTFGLANSKGGYYGILMGTGTSNANIMYDSSGNGGIYFQDTGIWQQYYVKSTNHLNVGTSSDLGYTLGVSGTLYGSTYVYSAGYVQAPTIYVGNIPQSQNGALIQQYSTNNSTTGTLYRLNNGSVTGYAYGDTSGMGILNGAGNWAVQAAGAVNSNNTAVNLYASGSNIFTVNSSGITINSGSLTFADGTSQSTAPGLGVSVRRTTSQSINTAWNAVQWDSTIYADSGYTVGSNYVQVTTTGRYEITANTQFSGGNGGWAAAKLEFIRPSPSATFDVCRQTEPNINVAQSNSPDGISGFSCATTMSLLSGDYFIVYVASGAPGVNSVLNNSNFSLTRVR
jgi:hypothetical protein